MSNYQSPHVNSARLPDYLHQTVRLPCKVLRLQDSTSEAIVSASDGGEVRVKLLGDMTVTSIFIEVVGNVTANDAIKAHAIIDMGNTLDLSLVNFVVEKCHDPKFAHMF